MSTKTRIVFVAGGASHGSGSHEHPGGCSFLADQLNDAVENMDAVVSKGWPSDPSLFENTDAIIVYSDGGGGHLCIPHLEQISKFAAQGIGIAMLHYAVEVPKGEPGDRFLEWIGGYFETHLSVNPHWTAEFTGFPEHPVTRGMVPFSLDDEWYYHMRFPNNMQDVVPVLSAVAPESTLKRPDGPHSGNPHVRASVANGEPQHLGWCKERQDGGRGFGFTGGHYHKNWGDDNLRRFILNAIAWTAKVEIPEDGLSTPTPSEADLNAYL
ncbi:MAG: ThuA domain-containing protein [Candidatus Poribacteria bacterium]|nr:ThuA domain-containing protein [Candidatus Poribacteria bacterium]